MIQSTDNLESTNYSHPCGDIFVKLSDLKEKNKSKSSTAKRSELSSVDSTTAGGVTHSIKGRLRSSKVNDGLSDKLKVNDKLAGNASSDKKSLTKFGAKSLLNDKLNDSLNEKKTASLNKKSADNLIDKSNLRTNNKKLSSLKADADLIDNQKEKKDFPKKDKKKAAKESTVKKDNIPINNRKRSDIENIFDLNSIKRVKAEMTSNLRRPLVFYGPSGSGKSTLLKKLIKEFPDYFGFSISHTTRQPRAGETHGQDYYYVTREEMLKAIENGEFIETAEFSGNMYGTSKKAVEDVRSKGKICILDIEIEGVKNIKKSDLNPVYIFVKPPNDQELENRRGSETEECIKKRLDRAKEEIKFGELGDNFDLLLINDNFDSAYEKLKTFVLENYGLPDTSLATTNEKADKS